MKGVLAFAVATAATVSGSPCAAEEIPLAEFSADDMIFTCVDGGLKSIRLRYDGKDRYLNYFNHAAGYVFHADDAVKSVNHSKLEDGGVWHLSASGPALERDGRPLGYDFDLAIDINRSASGQMSADFAVQIGDFRAQHVGCKPMRVPSLPGSP